jgi:porin
MLLVAAASSLATWPNGVLANREAGASPAIVGSIAYTGEFLRNVAGGLEEGGAFLDNLDVVLEAEPGSLFGIGGLGGLVHGLYNNGQAFSARFTGDIHVVSNIEAPRAVRLYEAWLDWAPQGDRGISTRVGILDVNAEFDVVDSGALFINSAHGMGTDFSQTGRNGPSIFPVTGLAARVRAALGDASYAGLVVADGVPGDPDDPRSSGIDLSSDDGALLVAEFGTGHGAWRKLAVGGWMYTADFERLDSMGQTGPPVSDDGNAGWYALADRALWSTDAGALTAFARVGMAEDDYSPFRTYLGGGLTLSGFVPGRPDDAAGIALAMGRTGSGFTAMRRNEGLDTDSHETGIELTYRAPLTDWLTLQPDVQYLINPGMDPQVDNAWVVSLRFELAWSRTLNGGNGP